MSFVIVLFVIRAILEYIVQYAEHMRLLIDFERLSMRVRLLQMGHPLWRNSARLGTDNIEEHSHAAVMSTQPYWVCTGLEMRYPKSTAINVLCNNDSEKLSSHV